MYKKFHLGPPMQCVPAIAAVAAIGMRQRRMCARGGAIGPRQASGVWTHMPLRCHFVSQEATWQAIRKPFVAWNKVCKTTLAPCHAARAQPKKRPRFRSSAYRTAGLRPGGTACMPGSGHGQQASRQ
jgi:hypothetical protein